MSHCSKQVVVSDSRHLTGGDVMQSQAENIDIVVCNFGRSRHGFERID